MTSRSALLLFFSQIFPFWRAWWSKWNSLFVNKSNEINYVFVKIFNKWEYGLLGVSWCWKEIHLDFLYWCKDALLQLQSKVCKIERNLKTEDATVRFTFQINITLFKFFELVFTAVQKPRTSLLWSRSSLFLKKWCKIARTYRFSLIYLIFKFLRSFLKTDPV